MGSLSPSVGALLRATKFEYRQENDSLLGCSALIQRAKIRRHDEGGSTGL
jgi:hypothetical protein